ncbi:MAG TPA: AAA family ATPase [Candidatus Dormibacteraeota bacterium]
MAAPPAEIRAFLICDVRGYTRFTLEQGDEAAAALAAQFAAAVRASVEGFGGEVIELRGDEALVVFTSARQALRAAVELQRQVTQLPLGVGAGLDAGEAVPVLGGFRGQALNLAARLCSLAGPGEVLASESLTHLAGRVDDVRYEKRGSVQLKGFTEPIEVVALAPPGAEPGAAPQAAAEEQPVPIGAYLGSLPAGPLIGRAGDWEHLLAALNHVGGDSGRTVLLAGEPGAGKTRLAQESMLELRDRGYVIAAGSCLETRQAVPYFPFLDVLPRLISAHRRAGGNITAWPYLERLVAGGAGAEAALGEEERVRRDVAGFVAELARRRPVAILLDDLHWADGATLELLHQLARQLRTAPVFLLGTYRDVEVRHDQPLERILRGLRRDELVQVIHVRRLDAEATANLVAASFGTESVTGEFSAFIHAQTDGNPFFVQQVLRMLVERGDIYREGGAWERREIAEIEVPESIRATIGERIGRLPQASQEALAAAAVLGQRFQFEDLRALLDAQEQALEEALEAAVASGLLRTESGDEYAFDHALAQQTLLAELPARRRRRLHGQAGSVIARRADRDTALAAEVAYHLLEADEPQEAARWSLVAGRHAEQVVALSEAEAHFRRAAELAQESGDDALRLEARGAQGAVLERIGRHEEAIAILTRVLDEQRANASADEQARTAARTGDSLMSAARAADVRAVLEPILDLPGLGPRARAALLVVLARSAFGLGDFPRLAEVARAALEAARAAGHRGFEAEALGRLALATGRLESNLRAAEMYREAIDLTDESVPLPVRATLHNNYAWNLFTLGDFAGNYEHRKIAAELSARYASPTFMAFNSVMVGQAELYRGNVEEAMRWVAAAEDLLAGQETSWRHGYVRGQHGVVLATKGDWAAAEPLLRWALAMAREGGDRQLTSWMTDELTDLLVDSGRAEEAVGVAEAELADHTAYHYRALRAIANAELAAGRFEAAAGHARSAIAESAAHRTGPETVDAMVVLGGALVRLGQLEEARTTLEDAVRLGEPMPYPAQVVRARLALARVGYAEGDLAQTGRQLQAAREISQRHGLLGLLRQGEDLARELTGAPTQR